MIKPRVSRAINAIRANRGTLTANEHQLRLSRLLPIVNAHDTGAGVFGLPDTWDSMTTAERTRWVLNNWSRLISQK